MNTEIEASGLAESTSSLHDEGAGASEGGLRMEGADAADAGRGDAGPLQLDGSSTQPAGPRRLQRFFEKLGIVLLGAAIFTLGVHNIHEVTGITEGGVIGFMLFLNKWFGIPSSIASPVLDIICYAVALKLLGGRFLGWSAIATAAVAGFYRVWESFPPLLPDFSGDPLVAAVLGGLFVGVGVGLVVRQGGSAGGDDALALSISKVTGWRVGRCYLFTDLSVLALSLSYIPFERIAWSLVTVTVSSAVIDIVGEISWDHIEELAEALRERRLPRLQARESLDPCEERTE